MTNVIRRGCICSYTTAEAAGAAGMAAPVQKDVSVDAELHESDAAPDLHVCSHITADASLSPL